MYGVCQARRVIWYKGGLKICPSPSQIDFVTFASPESNQSKPRSRPSRHVVRCKMTRRLRASGRSGAERLGCQSYTPGLGWRIHESITYSNVNEFDSPSTRLLSRHSTTPGTSRNSRLLIVSDTNIATSGDNTQPTIRLMCTRLVQLVARNSSVITLLTPRWVDVECQCSFFCFYSETSTE